MASAIVTYTTFVLVSIKGMFTGSARYWGWLILLLLLMAMGGKAYLNQAVQGLGVTGMTDQVSWGLYIANFTSWWVWQQPLS